MSPPVTPDPTAAQERRLAICLPRPLWIGLAALVLVLVGGGLRIGVPIWQQQAAIREIERLGGWVGTEDGGPDWLRRVVGRDWMKPFDTVTSADLSDSRLAPRDLHPGLAAPIFNMGDV
jgi:hypothetical protein